MLKICTLRVACYALAIATVLVTWYKVDASIVNTTFDMSEAFTKAIARIVTSFTTMSPTVAETLAVDKMHLDRTVVLGVLMLVWLWLILKVLRGHASWHVRHAFFALVVIHVALLVAWIGWTDATAAWYGWHESALKTLMRKQGWHMSETIVLKVLHLHSIIVIAELILIYSIISSVVEVGQLARAHAASRLDRARHA